MAELARNAARCLRCGDIIESKHTHDYVECSCGNIAVDGGPSYNRMAGRGLEDASYEALHQFLDGRSATGTQFSPFLDDRLAWNGGDGRALNRLVAFLVTGAIPDPDSLSGAGRRRLGYLTEIALTMSPEPEAEERLQTVLTVLRERVRLEPIEPEAIDQGWLPKWLAGSDQQAAEWGLGAGLSEEFRKLLRTRID
ncbi:hypothetical protein T8K17_25630 (plasmid) [Thalassobaculum sp. OXR-137]|uniref:DUF7695 domain-containing protein n=1 Tax=Thalassobaculum sp. OXR-137 TaxID=3100173 RepID=UPI002AC92971|nr:hypothetical protein [Thalassobaculum sp. OXR-137]WPZ37261.1 hypothetical protein T8K17_25630 [Thalassobaculum sp. OXR-137]